MSPDFMWPRNWTDISLCGWWFLIISHNPVKVCGHKNCCGRSNKRFFICHVTSCDHVINRLYNCMDKSPSSEFIILSSLVATGFAKEKNLRKNVFYLPRDHLTTWSNHHKTQQVVAFYYHLTSCQVWCL